jgi:hypothetical protein
MTAHGKSSPKQVSARNGCFSAGKWRFTHREVLMGKHDDDKNGSKQDPDPSKWEKPKDNGGGRHEKEDSDKNNPKN